MAYDKSEMLLSSSRDKVIFRAWWQRQVELGKSLSGKWERHETKQHMKGLSGSREVLFEVEVHEFYGIERYLSWKGKEINGLRRGLPTENERDKGLKISV